MSLWQLEEDLAYLLICLFVYCLAKLTITRLCSGTLTDFCLFLSSLFLCQLWEKAAMVEWHTQRVLSDSCLFLQNICSRKVVVVPKTVEPWLFQVSYSGCDVGSIIGHYCQQFILVQTPLFKGLAESFTDVVCSVIFWDKAYLEAHRCKFPVTCDAVKDMYGVMFSADHISDINACNTSAITSSRTLLYRLGMAFWEKYFHPGSAYCGSKVSTISQKAFFSTMWKDAMSIAV